MLKLLYIIYLKSVKRTLSVCVEVDEFVCDVNSGKPASSFFVYVKTVRLLIFKTTIKASDTLEHQPTVWSVPYACAQPEGYAMLIRPSKTEQLSMAATARVIWLCACVRYWPDRGFVLECVTCFYCCFTNF